MRTEVLLNVNGGCMVRVAAAGSADYLKLVLSHRFIVVLSMVCSVTDIKWGLSHDHPWRTVVTLLIRWFPD